jgi:hypothetical protein
MKLKEIVSKTKSSWLRLISPTTIGALEISSSSIKYLLLQNNSVTQASLRLPVDIIEKGKIKNPTLFNQALKNLHQQITPTTKPISVVLCAPQSLTYTQSFTIPMVAQNQLAESIKLNMQMISPTNFEESFYDYQEIAQRDDMGQIELLGAFSAKPPIGALSDALKGTGFIPVAIEFPALSLARLIRLRWGGLAQTEDYLVIYLSSEGLMALILKKGNLAFNRFTPWAEITKSANSENLTFDAIKEFIVDDISRVSTFYSGRTGSALENAILISPIFNYEIITFVRDRIGMTLHNLAIAELPKLQASWFPSLGAAIRGGIARSKDVEISLAEQNTQSAYLEEKIIDFSIVWRNIVAGTLILVLASLLIMNYLFGKQQDYLAHRIETEFSGQSIANDAVVQKKIDTFNKLISVVDATKSKERNWSPLLGELTKVAGSDIILRKVTVDDKLNFILAGSAKSDEQALAFKQRLLKLPFVASADLPLSQITRENETAVFFDRLGGAFKSLPTSTPATTTTTSR